MQEHQRFETLGGISLMSTIRQLIGAVIAASMLGLPLCSARADCPPIPQLEPDPFADRAPAPPEQIKTMTREHFDNSADARAGYCLYSPKSGGPADGLLLYLHGARPWEAGGSDAMLQFFANSGFYVVYPYVVEVLGRDGIYYPTLARSALADALKKLGERGVSISGIAVAGHSFGGAAAVRVAATWTAEPQLKALILHDPSGVDCNSMTQFFPALAQECRRQWDLSPAALLSVPCSIRLLIIQAQGSLEHPAQPTIFGQNAFNY